MTQRLLQAILWCTLGFVMLLGLDLLYEIQQGTRQQVPMYHELGNRLATVARAAWCTYGTDCTGPGGSIGGGDWNAARAAAVKSGDVPTGDLTGTYPNPTIAADSVALGTDTTGNYAAGDAEAGAATSVATNAVAQIADVAAGIKTGAGTGTHLVSANGAGPAGNCMQWDASGRAGDAGAACGSGSGSGAFTDTDPIAPVTPGRDLDMGTGAVLAASFQATPVDSAATAYTPATAGESTWFTGPNHDGVGDDNDAYEVRLSATPGTAVHHSLLPNDAQTWGDGTNASYTITHRVIGTDPVWTVSDGVMDLSTGALQVGGADVLTVAAGIIVPGGQVFPVSPQTGEQFVITDDSAVGACDSAGGSAITFCYYTGTIWTALGDGDSGSAAGLQANFAVDPTITGANSAGNAFMIGDGMDAISLWCESGECHITGPSGNPLAIKSNLSSMTTTPITLTAATCTNYTHYSDNATARTVELCAPTGGETVCVYDDAGSIITIDPDGTDTISLAGTDQSAGVSIVSNGTKGAYCCLQARSTTKWITFGCTGFSQGT